MDSSLKIPPDQPPHDDGGPDGDMDDYMPGDSTFDDSVSDPFEVDDESMHDPPRGPPPPPGGDVSQQSRSRSRSRGNSSRRSGRSFDDIFSIEAEPPRGPPPDNPGGGVITQQPGRSGRAKADSREASRSARRSRSRHSSHDEGDSALLPIAGDRRKADDSREHSGIQAKKTRLEEADRKSSGKKSV